MEQRRVVGSGQVLVPVGVDRRWLASLKRAVGCPAPAEPKDSSEDAHSGFRVVFVHQLGDRPRQRIDAVAA